MVALSKPKKHSYDQPLVAYFQEDYTCDVAFWLGVTSLMIGAATLVATAGASALIFGFSMSTGLHGILLGGGCLDYW